MYLHVGNSSNECRHDIALLKPQLCTRRLIDTFEYRLFDAEDEQQCQVLFGCSLLTQPAFFFFCADVPCDGRIELFLDFDVQTNRFHVLFICHYGTRNIPTMGNAANYITRPARFSLVPVIKASSAGCRA